MAIPLRGRGEFWTWGQVSRLAYTVWDIRDHRVKK